MGKLLNNNENSIEKNLGINEFKEKYICEIKKRQERYSNAQSNYYGKDTNNSIHKEIQRLKEEMLIREQEENIKKENQMLSIYGNYENFEKEHLKELQEYILLNVRFGLVPKDMLIKETSISKKIESFNDISICYKWLDKLMFSLGVNVRERSYIFD